MRGDEAAPVAPTAGDDQAASAESQECFAHGHRSDAETLAEIGFRREALAGAEVSAGDGVDEAALDELRPSLIADGLEQRALKTVRLLVLGFVLEFQGALSGGVRRVRRRARCHPAILPSVITIPKKFLLTYYLWVYMFW
ncbi:hypothetical protein GCM10009587_26120 [Microbacterium maritypicum]